MPVFSHLYSSALDLELGTDDSTRLFLTARRKSAIQRGVDEFADLTECLQRQSTISCSNGVGEYDLLSTVNVAGGDYSRPSKQRPEFQLISSGGASSNSTTYISGANFERRDVEWLNTYEPGWRDSTGGTPRYYYERMDGGKRYFGLFPPPEIGSSETGKVILPYVARPQTLSSDTDVPFSIASTAAGPSTGIRTDLETYHQAAVHFGAAQLEKLRLNDAGHDRQMSLFGSYVQRFLNAMKPKGGTTIKMTRSYFGEAKQIRGGADLPRPMSGYNYGG